MFPDNYNEMRGREWGRLYETYHKCPYDPKAVGQRVSELMQDYYVTDKKGVFEYVLGGEKDTRLLNVRLFEKGTITTVYNRQTEQAKKESISNCQMLCRTHNQAKGNR